MVSRRNFYSYSRYVHCLSSLRMSSRLLLLFSFLLCGFSRSAAASQVPPLSSSSSSSSAVADPAILGKITQRGGGINPGTRKRRDGNPKISPVLWSEQKRQQSTISDQEEVDQTNEKKSIEELYKE